MKTDRAFYLAPFDAIWPPIALLCIALGIAVVSYVYALYPLVFLATVGVFVLIGDCFGRSKDYRSARRRFSNSNSSEEQVDIVRRYRRAWCARVACNAAWKREHEQLDAPREFCSNVYRAMDYRWFHIFPDGTFTRHSPFLKSAFWVHLFTGKMKRDQKEIPTTALGPAE